MGNFRVMNSYRLKSGGMDEQNSRRAIWVICGGELLTGLIRQKGGLWGRIPFCSLASHSAEQILELFCRASKNKRKRKSNKSARQPASNPASQQANQLEQASKPASTVS